LDEKQIAAVNVTIDGQAYLMEGIADRDPGSD
jgi:hypothetical protein